MAEDNKTVFANKAIKINGRKFTNLSKTLKVEIENCLKESIVSQCPSKIFHRCLQVDKIFKHCLPVMHNFQLPK